MDVIYDVTVYNPNRQETAYHRFFTPADVAKFVEEYAGYANTSMIRIRQKPYRKDKRK